MAAQLLAYLDYREVNRGVASTLDEFREELRKFPRNTVLRLCAVMNSVIAGWLGDVNFEVQERFIRSLFPPNLSQRMVAVKRVVFHRHQLLFVAREALAHCNTIEGLITEPYAGGFGKVLLMASDHVHMPMPDDSEPPGAIQDKAINVMVTMLPSLEANHFTNYLDRIARSFLMLSRFTEPLREGRLFFDVRALFEEAAGIPLQVYQSLVWGSLSRFAKVERLRTTNDMLDFALPSAWFGSTRIPPAQIEAFLADVAASGEALATRLTQRAPAKLDFTIFRDKPLIREAAYSLPVDFTFVSDKLESGVFWRVHNHLPNDSDRDRFHSFWGLLFEQYLNWLFGQHCKGRANRFYPDPRFESNPDEQVCDGLVICGRSAVLMEYKGSTFTAASKYGGDADVLKREIEGKLVGTEARRKGVRQLVNAVERLCRRENTDGIRGIDTETLEVLIPVVITRDDVGSAWGLNAYLNERFRELKGAYGLWRPVTSLFSLSADDVEKISSYLSDTRLSDLLLARYRADRRLMSSFWTAGNRVVDKKGFRKPAFVYSALRELTELTADVLGLERRSAQAVEGSAGGA